jgi:hypothetical protein
MPIVPAPFRSALLLAGLVFAAGAAAAPAPQGAMRHPTSRPIAPETASPGGLPISPGLAKRFASGQPADYVIEMTERADLSRAAGMSWEERGRYVVDTLKATAEKSQAPVRRALQQRGLDFETHWIKNAIIVHRGDVASAKFAASLPGVARIRELPETTLIKPKPGQPVDPHAKAAAPLGVPENINWIGAPEAWAEGTRGHGVTVGVIDDGALYTHEALRQQYRGWRGGDVYEHDYNWFFPVESQTNETPVPGQHGTHVIGTIVGDDHDADPAARDRIGVAPGAQWIACLGLPVEVYDIAPSLLSCGEFMLAPTRTDGSDPKAELRPQVINNSWSEGNCNGEATSFYAEMVDAWVAAGIFPVFAAGNTTSCGAAEPPGLSSLSSPAALPTAFAVGSSGNHDGAYAPHSLWGPTDTGVTGDEVPPLPNPRGFPQLKPQVVAPGVDIYSAFDFLDGSYGTMTGTSMSSPHITGLVALMLDAGECLRGDYATLGTLIMSTARPVPYASGGTPAPGPGNVPNYATGWGEIDVPAAVHAASNACGPQGLIAGTITDDSGTPVGGAHIELFVDENVRVWDLFSEPDGSYARRLPENLSGGYQLRVTAYGYLPFTRTGLEVADEQTVTADVQLDTAPLARVHGRVTDETTGWPLLAKLTVSSYPGGEIWTDPLTGEYEVQLPTAASYRFDVASDIAGYSPATTMHNVTADATLDFGLEADPVTCTAPGYTYAAQRFAEDFEAGTPPTGWSTSSAGAGWTFGTRDELHDPQFFSIPKHPGRFAASIEPLVEGGNDGRFDYLVSPPFDLTGTADPVVRFTSRYWASGLRDGGAYVQASDDDGATWQALGAVEQFQPAWTEEALSLAAFAGRPNVRLRFHYDDGSTASQDLFNPGWAVDDVRVVTGCHAPADGSLVIGQVRDANTQAPLDGAVVSANGLEVSTQSNAVRGPGFFAIHAPAGNPTLTASRGTLPEGYGDGQRSLAVGSGSTLETTIELPAGVLEFDPAGGPQATLTLGTTATVPFTLRNAGTRDLSFALEGTHLEQHFDALEFPPPGWSATDNGGECTWKRGDGDNGAGGDGPYAEIDLIPCTGGQPRIDHSLLLPAVDLSQSDSASIGFFLYLSAGDIAAPRFAVEVSTDAGATWTAAREWDYGTFPHELIEIDLSAFVGHADVRIRFRLEAQPPYATLQIDQVHVFREIGEDTAVDVLPATGTLAAGAPLEAEAVFDASHVAQPGTYTIPIRVAEDTPYVHPFGDLNGTMIVTAPAHYGSIAGTVRSLGRCEANPQPYADLAVRIVDDSGDELTVRTDVDGHYRYFADPAQGPFTVHVDGEAHQAAQRTLDISAGNETAADFDLRPLAACLATDPAVLHVAANAGGQGSAPFQLGNLGPVASAYSVRAGGDPTQLSPMRITQNSVATPTKDASTACLQSNRNTLETRWYRVYPLAERGYAGAEVLVDSVSFGADVARSVAGTQNVVVSLYTLQGEFTLDNLTLLASKTATFPDGELLMREIMLDAPVAVSTDATLVVEVAKLDGAETESLFVIAGNSEPDDAPAWIYAPALGCDITQPSRYDDVGLESLSPIIDPVIRASDACGDAAVPVLWLEATPAAGNVGGDAEVTLQATADAADFTAGTQHGAFCIAGPNATDRELVLPVELHVDVPAGEEVFANGFE